MHIEVEVEVQDRADGRVGCVRVAGEMDLATCGALVDAVRRAVRDRVVVVEVDLHDVWFLEVVSAEALIRCRRIVHARGGAFRLVSPSPAVGHLLTATGLGAVFDVLDRRAK